MVYQPQVNVFISSTSIDLPEYRRVVVDACLSLGLFPDGMEHWPVEDENPIDLCHDKINRAEIFVGIYAYRYGWQPVPDGPSITEMEYDWATERGIPRLCFVVSDQLDWPKSRRQKDGQKRLEAFKARVKTKVVGFFTTPDDLKAQVTVALAKRAPIDLNPLRPYLNWLHRDAMQSGLMRAIDPRSGTIQYRDKQVTVDQVYVDLDTRSKSPVMQIVARYPYLVLLGDPGSGKSTLVKFLTLCLTGEVLDSGVGWLSRLVRQGWTGVLVPVVIMLRDLAQNIPPTLEMGTAYHLWEYIAHRLEDCNCQADEILRLALDRGRVLLMLDGLDEVPETLRDRVREIITDFMQAYPNNRYLVTCRILSYANPDWHLPGLPVETLAPLDESKIDYFIRAWYTAAVTTGSIDTRTAEDRIDDLRAALRDRHLMEIGSNPMLLTVMALVHSHTGALPREAARLYARCVDLLMFQWKPHAAHWLMDQLKLREDDLYRALWELAYEAHCQQTSGGSADISEADIVGLLKERWGSIQKAEQFCQYVEQRAGLLVGRGQKSRGWRVFAFPHRTFQEYLAGCHIASSRRSLQRLFVEKSHEGAHWREALLLAIGHLVFNENNIETPIDVIKALVDSSLQSDVDWRTLWFAGDITLLVGTERVVSDDVGCDVLPLLRKQLATLVSGGHLTIVERASVGRLLDRIGDPRYGVGLRADGLPEIDWVEIPGRHFLYGDEAEHDSPPKVLTLPTFEMARYPITYAQFECFANAPDFSDARWWSGMPEEHEASELGRHICALKKQASKFGNHPRENISWYQAVAFCRWLSDRLGYEVTLPTEQQWERAARGKDGNIYPYGNEFDAEKGNVFETGIEHTSAVGIFPQGASPEGLLDMSGNVWEWCLNKYHHPEDAAIDASGDSRIVRGGVWNLDHSIARAFFRVRYPPMSCNNFIGFRVCRFPFR